MNFSVSLSTLVTVLEAVLLPNGSNNRHSSQRDTPIIGVSTDSRRINPGEVFIALEGDTFDGHLFLDQAHEAGAIAAVVRYVPEKFETLPFPLVQVSNTLKAYQAIGHWWRHQLQTPVVAITGSVGKTTTKELIAAVLASSGSVLKTQANYNNEIGVPKTLLGLETTHTFAVVEMGMRGPGEIAELTQIATPDIGVITNVGTAHIGRLGSEEAIANAKCELLANLPPHGIAILNADNQRLMDTAPTVWQGTTITYGLTHGDIRGALLEGDRLRISGVPGAPLDLPLPLSGEHNALNYLAAIAVARALQLNWSDLTARLAQGIDVHLPSGRARQILLPNDIVLLDETYNAGFESMTAALRLLAKTPGQRRIAVLGTMKELGDWSVNLHQRVGALVAELELDQLMILADPEESQALASGADSVPSYVCSTPSELVERLTKSIQSGDRILFKASRSVGLEQVVERVQAHLSPS